MNDENEEEEKEEENEKNKLINKSNDIINNKNIFNKINSRDKIMLENINSINSKKMKIF